MPGEMLGAITPPPTSPWSLSQSPFLLCIQASALPPTANPNSSLLPSHRLFCDFFLGYAPGPFASLLPRFFSNFFFFLQHQSDVLKSPDTCRFYLSLAETRRVSFIRLSLTFHNGLILYQEHDIRGFQVFFFVSPPCLS